jgi:hypothetical protein
LSDLDKKDRNKRHSSPFINVVKGVFFVVRATLVPVSYLSAPSAVHSYRVPGKFIRRLKSLFVFLEMGCCLLDITPYPFIFYRYLANIPVFQSLNIIVLQVGGITQ